MKHIVDKHWFSGLYFYLLIPFLLNLCLAPAQFVSASTAQPGQIHIGVLAKDGHDKALERWLPMADYLSQQIPDYSFSIVPINFDALMSTVAQQEIDFVLVNPSIYIQLEADYGASRMVTLKSKQAGHALQEFGGVIFTRADNANINTLQDLTGKQLLAVDALSLGGYQMALREIDDNGLRDDIRVNFAGHHETVVEQVLAGQADAGTVRTGVLERMMADARLPVGAVKIIHSQSVQDFPLALSTRLYPEWPFARLSHTATDLSDRVASALLRLNRDDSSNTPANSVAWSVAHNYQSIHQLMQQLHLKPYQNLHDISLSKIISHYWPWFLAVALLMLLNSLVTFYISRQKNRIFSSHENLINASKEMEFDMQQRNAELVSALEDIEKQDQQRQLILNSSADGIFGVDAQGSFSFVNPAALAMLGYKQNELLGQTCSILLPSGQSDGAEKSESIMKMVLATGQPRFIDDAKFKCRNGDCIPVQYFVVPVFEKDYVHGMVVSFRDMSETNKTQEELVLAAIAFETSEAIMITNEQGIIQRVNNAFSKITGYSADEVIGHTPKVLSSGRHDQIFYQAIWLQLAEQGRWEGEIWNQRRNGDIFPEWLVITAVNAVHGGVNHYVATFRDISDSKQDEQRIKYQAHYDALTDLPNRSLLIDRLRQAMAQAIRRKNVGVLMFLDMDNFKAINDSLGHTVGDMLLRKVASRLKLLLRKEDTAARLGGDEFIVLATDISDDEEVAAHHSQVLAEKIIHSLSQPYVIEDQELHISASIGIVLFPTFGEDADDVLKFADIAMYKAKEKGRNCFQFYLPLMKEKVNERRLLEKDLRFALEHQQLELYYQPQVDNKQRIVGAEALLRWNHPERGMVSPAEFIPVAEECGLILPLGHWVLREACVKLKQFTDCLKHDFRLAVNVSPLQFQQNNYIQKVKQVIAETGVDSHCLELELTEGMLISDVDKSIEKMRELQTLGISFAIDDFGTGYSSLTYLRELPLNKLKVDQSFIRDLHVAPNDTAIVKTILSMARHLQLKMVAEGVENQQQLMFLQQNGCDVYQGYYFSKALPLEQFKSLLQQSMEEGSQPFSQVAS